ncbi:CYTH and CHAD domain-containing protein [Luteococcus sp. H138]|uniref:CYTH and CHAD domain-containing protein n=1 Tax=unclassified Luteococcus TaxID=2639923 RepID=UPI00313D5CAA
MAVEIERKFRLPDGKPITDLGDVATLGVVREMSLRASYFDTPELLLARNAITLRRRTGGHDEGWHLKLPGEGHAREELGAEILPDASPVEVPLPFREHLAELIGTSALIPIAQLDTERRATDLVVPDGRAVAVLCEDAVTVRRIGHGAQPQQWREVEVELTADGALLDLEEISTQLVAQGAEPQPPTSKLVQALGDLLSRRGDDEPTAAAVVTSYLAAQVGMIQAMEAQVRIDAPDAVHRMRVATRRLRSTLRVFRDLLDAERTAVLRDEVRWLGEMLGGPRDAEVLKARLSAALDALPAEAVLGPVRERLGTELDARHAETHRELEAALDSERYRALLESLVGLVTEPPFRPEADRPADEALRPPLHKATRRVTRRWAAAQEAVGDERTQLAHEARKKAKAARYAWEAAEPAFDKGDRATQAWKQVTETLGTAQDTVVARQRLLELARIAQQAGEETFTYGVLYGRELAHQDDAHDESDHAIRRAKRASAR